MKLLWFTNTYVPEYCRTEGDTLRGSGGWMFAMLQHLCTSTDYQIAVATAQPVKQFKKYSVGGIDCFVVPARKNISRINTNKALKQCATIVEDWQPDLIHIHGTERFYGLLSARNIIDTPTVISIQGLLGPYSEWYHYFGNRSLQDIIRMHRVIEPFVFRGQIIDFLNYRKAAWIEKEIIEGNKYFLGRTLWDKSHLFKTNHRANYYHVGELLREPFWQKKWELSACKRHRIIFTNAGHPRKGTEVLLDAVRVLKNDFPDIEVCFAGTISTRNGYGRYIRKRFSSLGANVKELGPLNAEEMSKELSDSHIFVSPSFIDNSPNAVCEAQLMGMPVISSYTGGVPNLIEEGQTGLFFPCGDAAVLSQKLKEIFINDELAERLGIQAHNMAIKRHDSKIVIQQLIKAYQTVLHYNDNY